MRKFVQKKENEKSSTVIIRHSVDPIRISKRKRRQRERHSTG